LYNKIKYLADELDKFDLIAKNLNIVGNQSEKDEYLKYISQNSIQIKELALD
jgi:hypothetical protein